jgi:hypothetical protein
VGSAEAKQDELDGRRADEAKMIPDTFLFHIK